MKNFAVKNNMNSIQRMPEQSHYASHGLKIATAPVQRNQLQQLPFKTQLPLQRKSIAVQLSDKPTSTQSKSIHQAAAAGVQGTGSKLPHLDKIQKSFGRFDVTNVQTYSGSSAAAANKSMGAEAYATGNKIAFSKPAPSLHTTAHEAAHVIQQRAGVHLKDGVGRANDEYERHADAVADRVVQGKSAESLLNSGHLSPVAAQPTKQNWSQLQQSAVQLATAATIANKSTHKLKKEVSWAATKLVTVDSYSQQDGDHMTAKVLDPENVSGGSKPQANVQEMPRKLTKKRGRRYISGHLLNEHLGGPGGEQKNITAFSSKVNSLHLHQVEKNVKDAVLKYKNYVYYEVGITKRDKTTNEATQMETAWHILGTDGQKADNQVTHKAIFDLSEHNISRATSFTLNLFTKKSLENVIVTKFNDLKLDGKDLDIVKKQAGDVKKLLESYAASKYSIDQVIDEIGKLTAAGKLHEAWSEVLEALDDDGELALTE